MKDTVEADFRSSAIVWWHVAARLLGWRPAEFWQATPCEILGALQEPDQVGNASAPSRELINSLMERDSNGH